VKTPLLSVKSTRFDAEQMSSPHGNQHRGSGGWLVTADVGTAQEAVAVQDRLGWWALRAAAD
jgi:hypothetical protein